MVEPFPKVFKFFSPMQRQCAKGLSLDAPTASPKARNVRRSHRDEGQEGDSGVP